MQPKKQKARLSLRQNNSENSEQTELHSSNLKLKDIRLRLDGWSFLKTIGDTKRSGKNRPRRSIFECYAAFLFMQDFFDQIYDVCSSLYRRNSISANIRYYSLLEMEEPRAVYVKKKERSEISEGKYHIYNYYPKNAERNFEVYQIEMDAGCDHTSVGHCANSFEYLVLTDGKITISLNEKDYILEKDDALYFDASQPHRYKNEEASSAKMTMVIQYL